MVGKQKDVNTNTIKQWKAIDEIYSKRQVVR